MKHCLNINALPIFSPSYQSDLLLFAGFWKKTDSNIIKIIFAFLLIVSMISCKKEDPEPIGVIEKFQISSDIVNDNYDIHIYMPSNYGKNIKKNQLIIGLDAEFRFDEIVTIISEKSSEGSIPPCIFVAIGNSENRNRDYTPTAFKHGKGGADNFYQFIIKELVPELELKFNVDTSGTKTLIGNSFGGLFTHFAMFQERESSPFDKFISVGCSYWYDSGIIFEYEEKYTKTHKDLPVRFFNGMGTLEGGVLLASFEEMNERLINRTYPEFQLEAFFIKKQGHSGAANIGFKKGLDYVFNN